MLKMELSNADIANAVAEASGTEVRIFYSCHNLSAEDFEKRRDISYDDAKERRYVKGGFELMALITCENVSIGYEGQTVVKRIEFFY